MYGGQCFGTNTENLSDSIVPNRHPALAEQNSEVYVDEMCAYFFFIFFSFSLLYRVNVWHRFIVVCKVRTFFQSESIGPSFFPALLA